MAESLHILLGTSACLQWLCHSGERTVAHGPLIIRILLFSILLISLIASGVLADLLIKMWDVKCENLWDLLIFIWILLFSMLVISLIASGVLADLLMYLIITGHRFFIIFFLCNICMCKQWLHQCYSEINLTFVMQKWCLTLSTLGKIFSRWHFERFYSVFVQKQVLAFHANCP